MTDTKEKLLDTAEALFGTQGFSATSLRQIIAEAGTNLAAIHYHFGSKEELLDAIVIRKAGPVNEERLKMLDAIEAAGGRPDVERILEAFLMPMAAAGHESPGFVRLMGRIQAEGLLMHVIQRNFQQVLARFLPVLRSALPHLSDEEFRARLHFMIGAMSHTMCGAPDFTNVAADPGGLTKRMERLIRFLSGAFRAPAPKEAQVEVTK
jgi:AcrR family transcriptional regulator